MLETEIQSLRTEIADLKQAVNSLTATMLGITYNFLPTATATEPTGVKISSKKVQQPAPEPEPAPEPAPAPALTVDDLQALCSELVRADASIKPKIKELIASFDGAKTLSKVPANRLPELKAALEALQ
jgi:hypothetical protein